MRFVTVNRNYRVIRLNQSFGCGYQAWTTSQARFNISYRKSDTRTREHKVDLINGILLCELTRQIEIQHDLTKESSKYVRHAVRNSSPPSVGVNGTTSTGSEEEQQNKIAAGHAELEKLANERVALAMRIVSLVKRTRTRLEGDLVRIAILQGEVEKGGVGAPVLGGTAMANGGGVGESGEIYVMHGRNAAVAISESLRHALSGGAGAGGEPLPKSGCIFMEGVRVADEDHQSVVLGVLLLRRSSCRAVDMHDRDCLDRFTQLKTKEKLMGRERKTQRERR